MGQWPSSEVGFGFAMGGNFYFDEVSLYDLEDFLNERFPNQLEIGTWGSEEESFPFIFIKKTYSNGSWEEPMEINPNDMVSNVGEESIQLLYQVKIFLRSFVEQHSHQDIDGNKELLEKYFTEPKWFVLTSFG